MKTAIIWILAIFITLSAAVYQRLTGPTHPFRGKVTIGQEQIKQNLDISISAAKMRKEPLDHCLFYGPPGLGKTTLAHIIASEMGSNLKTTSGPVIEKSGDLAALLTNLQPDDILFIDEIHRLPKQIEEILYPAMEDYQLDIMIGQGPSARSIKLELPPFTLVGATTRAGSLTSPLRDRFGVVHRLDFYSSEELSTILHRSAKIMGVEMSESGCQEISRRSRGTPRIANRLLRRVRDYAQVKADGIINPDIADKALALMEVSEQRGGMSRVRVARAEMLLALGELDEAARLSAQSDRSYLVAYAPPSLPDIAVEPKRVYKIATVFVVSLLAFGVGALILGAVREHARA